MSKSGSIPRKLLKMFIEDRNFALSIIVWVFAYWLVVPSMVASPAGQAVILFAGLGVILADSVLRQARR
ncbi:MAG TPA: hypothetical protein VFR20_03610 [Burkholderiaceae bacterium]|nr:hypothetical protein [Burkholderiaceae bacterium]